MQSFSRLLGCAVFSALAGCFFTAGTAQGAAIVSVSSPYLSQANSTLNTASPTYFLEDFEDGVLNLPGVSVSAIAGSGIQSGLSVDGDDGSIDGSGAAGKHYAGATQAGQQNTTFFFSQVAGQWPKQVAIAVTAGATNSLNFGAYDPNSNPSGSLTMNVNLIGSTTADDFLVTFIDNAGISAIAMTSSNAFTFMHYDHLQFDTAAAVPEPTGLAGLALGASMLLRRRRIAK